MEQANEDLLCYYKKTMRDYLPAVVALLQVLSACSAEQRDEWLGRDDPAPSVRSAPIVPSPPAIPVFEPRQTTPKFGPRRESPNTAPAPVAEDQIQRARKICSEYGYKVGSEKFAQCVERQHSEMKTQEREMQIRQHQTEMREREWQMQRQREAEREARCNDTTSDINSALACSMQSSDYSAPGKAAGKTFAECLAIVKRARGCP